jgi:uncharacterized membrane protein
LARGRGNRPPPARPPDRRDQQSLVAVSSSWQGPLPSPDDLARYGNIVEGGAERLVREWEAEAAHRRAYEQRALRIEGLERILSRVFAYTFAMAALGVVVYCATIGQPWVAAVIGGGMIAAVVASLIRGPE